MRSFALLTAVVLVAIGVGVAIEGTFPTSGSATAGPLPIRLPAPLRAAVVRTMDVSSLEASEAGDTLIYNAPDRLEIRSRASAPGAGLDEIIIGDTVYGALTSTTYARETLSRAARVVSRSRVTPAAGEMFQLLRYLSYADGAQGSGTRYSIVPGRPAGGPRGTIQILGGSVRLGGGYVTFMRLRVRERVRVRGSVNEQEASLTVRYNDVNKAPTVVAPPSRDVAPSCKYGYTSTASGTPRCQRPPPAPPRLPKVPRVHSTLQLRPVLNAVVSGTGGRTTARFRPVHCHSPFASNPPPGEPVALPSSEGCLELGPGP